MENEARYPYLSQRADQDIRVKDTAYYHNKRWHCCNSTIQEATQRLLIEVARHATYSRRTTS